MDDENVYVADTANNRIRKIDSSQQITTLAGNGVPGYADGTGGPDGTAMFSVPFALTVGSSGNIYVADMESNRIRSIDTFGQVTTLAGNGLTGWQDGLGTIAEFGNPRGIVAGPNGNIYISDTGNSRIRKIDTSGFVSTIAGTSQAGFADGRGGPGGTAQFTNPIGIAIALDGSLYIADSHNNRIRKIAPNGLVTTIAGNGIAGYADGTGGPTGTAEFNYPSGVVIDKYGYLLITDTFNNCIRIIDAAGNVSTLAGTNLPGTTDGTGRNARFTRPSQIAVRSDGQVFISDPGTASIRELSERTINH